jgi:hypothetical protein
MGGTLEMDESHVRSMQHDFEQRGPESQCEVTMLRWSAVKQCLLSDAQPCRVSIARPRCPASLSGRSYAIGAIATPLSILPARV